MTKIRLCVIFSVLLLSINLVSFSFSEEFEKKLNDTISMSGEFYIPSPSRYAISKQIDQLNEIIVLLNDQIEIHKVELEKSTQLNIILGIGGLVAVFVVFFVGRILSNRQTNQIIRAMVEIANAGYRITKVDSGKVAIREGGEIGADLVKVVGGKRIVAEKQVAHSTDTFIAEPKKQSENNNEDSVNSKSD